MPLYTVASDNFPANLEHDTDIIHGLHVLRIAVRLEIALDLQADIMCQTGSPAHLVRIR